MVQPNQNRPRHPLTALRLRNWQTHRNLAITFDSPVTTITGPSDSGKSAILRAFFWVLTSRPAGGGMVTHGEKDCWAAIHMDGTQVVRTRTAKGGNEYRVGDVSYAAVGVNVPEAVRAALRLDPDVNFMGQHDGPFWFALTPGEVAKRINSILDLGLIDDVLGKLGGQVRDLNIELRMAGDEHAAAQRGVDAVAGKRAAINVWAKRVEPLGEEVRDTFQNVAAVLKLGQGAAAAVRRARTTGAVADAARLCRGRYDAYCQRQMALDGLRRAMDVAARPIPTVPRLAIPAVIWADLPKMRAHVAACRVALDGAGRAKALAVVHTANHARAVRVRDAHAAYIAARDRWAGLVKAINSVEFTESVAVSNQQSATEQRAKLRAEFKMCEACGRPL